MLKIQAMVDFVADALAFNRSMFAPSEVVRHGPLWILRDVDAQPGMDRVEEIFAYGAMPAEVQGALENYAPRGRYALQPFIPASDGPEEAKAAYKTMGYRFLGSEVLFACPLRGRIPAAGKWSVSQVTSLDEARRVSTEVYGRATRKLRLQDLTDHRPAMRLYYVEIDGRAVAAARSLMPHAGLTWVADVSTLPQFRRRGIATALMNHLLDEDARLGSKYSILLAGNAGSKLYPLLGYQEIALLLRLTIHR